MMTHDSNPTLSWEISIDPRGTCEVETASLPTSIGNSVFGAKSGGIGPG